MADYLHPASLNVLQQFRQANAIFRHTSRAGNPAWYKNALDLDLQIHIRTDGTDVTTFYYNRPRNHWSAGPALEEADLQNPEKITDFAAEILTHAKSLPVTAIGVILYIGDEFAITELKLELNDPASLPELRQAALHSPQSVLEDSSLNPDKNTWRVLPYPGNAVGATIGTTVSVTDQYRLLLDELRKFGERENFPIITHALSAPLVALLGIPGTVTRNPDRPFVAILQYPSLTVLAFFNQQADLLLLRTQQHRGLKRPPNFRQTVSTTNASLEIVDPDIFIFPLGRDADTTLITDLGRTFANSHLELVRPRDTHGLPSWAVEPVIAVSPPMEEHTPGVTFDSFRNDGWAFQDFLPKSKEEAELYPSQLDMRLMRYFRHARYALLGISILALLWLTVGYARVLFKEEWFFKSTEAEALQKRIGMLNVDRKKSERLENLLEDRSKAWSSMELLARLFPEKSGAVVGSFNLSVRPQNTPGQAKVGFIKEWKITGFANAEALEYLNTINSRDGLAAHFAEIAKVTGNTAFDPNIPSRTLVVNIKTQESENRNRVRTDDVGFNAAVLLPYTFELSITQRFEASDPLAINVSKAP